MVYFFMFFRYLTIGHHLISQLCTSQKYKVHIQRVHVMQDFDTFHFLRCWKIYILNHWTIFFELQCGITLVPCSSHDLQDSNNRGMGEEGATLYDGALTGNSIVLHSGRGAVRQRSYIVAFLSAALYKHKRVLRGIRKKRENMKEAHYFQSCTSQICYG